MNANQDNSAVEAAGVSLLAQEISQLRDLFQRRLMDDKQRNRLYDAVLEQNAALNKQLENRALDSFAKEILLICDRIEAYGSDSDFVNSILDELLEVLARRGVEPITELSEFNPQWHHAVGVVADDTLENNSIAAVKRNGYRIADRLLRVAEVVVALNGENAQDTL